MQWRHAVWLGLLSLLSRPPRAITSFMSAAVKASSNASMIPLRVVRHQHNHPSGDDLVPLDVASFGVHLDLTVPRTEAMQLNELLRLQNVADAQYLGELLVGSPAEAVSVIFDTGSSDLWISDDKYLSSRSTSSRCPDKGCGQTAEIQYSVGDVTGKIVVDKISLGSRTIPRQDLLMVEKMKDLDNRMFDGVFGLAFPALSRTGTYVLQNLAKQAAVERFSFVISDTEENSFLVLGDPPDKWFARDSLVYAPVVYQAWWTFSAGMSAGSTILIENSEFCLDSGTSFLAIPKESFAAVVSALLPPEFLRGCSMRPSQNMVWCSCAAKYEMQVLYLDLGGQKFPMYPEDILVENGGGGDCILSLQSLHGEGMPWILGDTFLRTVVSTFDIVKPRISIAKRNDHVPKLSSTQRRLDVDAHSKQRGPLLKPYMPGAPFQLNLWNVIAVVLFGACAGMVIGECVVRIHVFCIRLRRRRAANVAPIAEPLL